MKKLQTLFLVLISIIGIGSLSSCRKVIGHGAVVREERIVSNFTRVQTSIPGAVYVKEGPLQIVSVEAQQNIIDVVETKVEDGVLKLKLRNHTLLANGSNLKVYITLPKYREISLLGSGNVRVDNGLNSTEIDLKVTGSGTMELDQLNSEYLYCELTGSGNMELLSGTTASQTIRLTGSGDYKAKNLQSNHAEVTLTGSGHATLRAANTLNVVLSGSGNVYYYGNPVLNVNITGSGNVNHKND